MDLDLRILIYGFSTVLILAILVWIKKKGEIHFYKKSVISRDGDTTPYLIRYNLLECKWFSIKIHHILQSDMDCPHDHPWAFWSIILKGGYIERVPKWVGNTVMPRKKTFDWGIANYLGGDVHEVEKIFRAGSFLRRPAGWVHRLELMLPDAPKVGYLRPATTLVITFKKTREWGFWTKAGWVPWFKYHAQNKCV